jgi:hypothetical protein
LFKTTDILLYPVSTKLIDIPAHQVIIIAVTDGYTSFLSVLVSISLSYPFVVRSG